eukprot:2143286-Pyramimonas_sp.AAC.1
MDMAQFAFVQGPLMCGAVKLVFPCCRAIGVGAAKNGGGRGLGLREKPPDEGGVLVLMSETLVLVLKYGGS